IAIAMYAAAPARCVSLILADTFAVHPEGRAIYERSIAASADMRALAEGRADALLAQPADAAVRSEVVETMAKIDSAAFCIGAEAVWLADQRGRAREIHVPTLVVCGTEDRVTPPPLSRDLTHLIPGAQYEPIADAGHLSNLERPVEFNAVAKTFVEGVEART
uniref:alpha/beta fold hydrolase n=1 Tax=Sphingomonas sp. TaxID=28214 RepID=UPI00286B0A42